MSQGILSAYIRTPIDDVLFPDTSINLNMPNGIGEAPLEYL